MNSTELTLYRDLLVEIKSRVQHGQSRVSLSVNAELIQMYWDIGQMIKSRKEKEGWGAAVIPRLASDIKSDLADIKGFSETNLKRMVYFASEYPDLFPISPRSVGKLQVPEDKGDAPKVLSVSKFGPQTVGRLQLAVVKIPWGHNIILIEKFKDPLERLWYADKVYEQGWSRETLISQIKSGAHARQGSSVTNFSKTLPPEQSMPTQQLLKDPYIFDFLTMADSFKERELENGLLQHLQKFLLELGRGFAFVGRQYRLEIGVSEFLVDLLFYNFRLRRFVVIDLKTGPFIPEYAGKMNFYCNVVDEQLRHADDQPTIGLILCQSKDRVVAEYSLRTIEKPIDVSDYEITKALPQDLASSLPSIEEIEAELQEDQKERPSRMQSRKID